VAIEKLLIEEGADSKVQGECHENSLQAGSSKGHEEIVKLPMDKLV